MRLLKADEIECRVGQKSKDGSKYSVLLYKTSRTDMTILDEIYGPTGWRNHYEMVGPSMFCTIEIWDNEKKIWIAKQSNGSESNIEAEKGLASDCMKRAGFMLGIGRELYSAPQIWLKSDINQYNLFVREIGYDANQKINHLIISDGKTDVYNNSKQVEPKKVEPKKTGKKVEDMTRGELLAEITTIKPDFVEKVLLSEKNKAKGWTEVQDIDDNFLRRSLNAYRGD